MTEKVNTAQARRSALTVALVLGAIAAWQVYRARPTAALVLGDAALVLAVIGLFVPPAARAFHRGWMAIAEALGYVNSRIILSVIYYLLLTPLGMLLRATRHDPLDRRAPRRPSYWIPRKTTRQTREQFERAF